MGLRAALLARAAIILALVCTLVGIVNATDVPTFERMLPRTYSGEFRWDHDRIRQKIEVRITAIKPLDGQEIEALGCGRYEAQGTTTHIGIRMIVNVPTLAVEIWERDPVGNAAFITDGSHKGKFTDNLLQRIDAVWVSRADERRGRLSLVAGGAVRCANEAVYRQGSTHNLARL
jgi:hypothetical protein